MVDKPSISDQVKAAMERKGSKKFKVAEHLDITRVTLNKRLKHNGWEPAEITLLKLHGYLI